MHREISPEERRAARAVLASMEHERREAAARGEEPVDPLLPAVEKVLQSDTERPASGQRRAP